MKDKAQHIDGTVTKSTGSWYTVETAQGTLQCRTRGRLRLKGIKSTNPVAVGDRVSVLPQADEPGQGIISALAERKNYMVRRSVNLSKQVQVIAANIDQAVLIATLADPPTFQRFIDRFAVTAEAYAIPFILVFNKVDLYSAAQLEELEFLEIIYADAGYSVLRTSATEGVGLEDFAALLHKKRSLLSGHSGVGKSTLINTVAPELDLRTQRISSSHGQGQHTTTFAEMFTLDFGGQVIDTPGIKGFGLVDMEKTEIGDYFPEIFRLKKDCKFHNCLHTHEPGCAVKAAVEEARLPLPRYESYLSFVEGTDTDDTYRKDIYAE